MLRADQEAVLAELIHVFLGSALRTPWSECWMILGAGWWSTIAVQGALGVREVSSLPEMA
jgi:hypothetical protein